MVILIFFSFPYSIRKLQNKESEKKWECFRQEECHDRSEGEKRREWHLAFQSSLLVCYSDNPDGRAQPERERQHRQRQRQTNYRSGDEPEPHIAPAHPYLLRHPDEREKKPAHREPAHESVPETRGKKRFRGEEKIRYKKNI